MTSWTECPRLHLAIKVLLGLVLAYSSRSSWTKTSTKLPLNDLPVIPLIYLVLLYVWAFSLYHPLSRMPSSAPFHFPNSFPWILYATSWVCSFFIPHRLLSPCQTVKCFCSLELFPQPTSVLEFPPAEYSHPVSQLQSQVFSGTRKPVTARQQPQSVSS